MTTESTMADPQTGADPAARGPQRRLPEWRLAALSVVPALVVTGAVFVWMIVTASHGTNTAGLQMPPMDLEHRVSYWWPFLMGETLGVAALIWTYLSVLIGLVFSSTTPRLGLSRKRLIAFHRYVSLTGLALIAAHVVFVAVGSMNGAMTARATNWSAALLPFQTAWNAQFYNVGVFALYLAVLLGPTYYLRRWIGDRAWRIIHRASLAVYVLSVWHSFGFDDFSFHGGYRLALWLAQIPLAGLMLWRLGKPVGSARNLRRTMPLRFAFGATTMGLLAWVVVVVATGDIGGLPAPR